MDAFRDLVLLLLVCPADAFRAAPGALAHERMRPSLRARPAAMLDLGSAASWLADAAAAAPDVSDAVSAAADASTDTGWFDFLIVKPCEFSIVSLHGMLKGMGVEQAASRITACCSASTQPLLVLLCARAAAPRRTLPLPPHRRTARRSSSSRYC